MKQRKATDVLLADHKMIRKIISELDWDHPRFETLSRTLHRIVVSHAWFEDEIFLPAFKSEPRLSRRFVDEIIQDKRFIKKTLHGLKAVDIKDLVRINRRAVSIGKTIESRRNARRCWIDPG